MAFIKALENILTWLDGADWEERPLVGTGKSVCLVFTECVHVFSEVRFNN